MIYELLLIILGIIILRFIIHYFQQIQADNIIAEHKKWKKKNLNEKLRKPLIKREIKKILVTGGCGNFGASLIDLLCERFPNSKIICLDLVTKESTEQVTYVKGNMTNIENIFKYFKDIDAVFHTAAAIALDCDRSSVLKINLFGTQNIVECCIENNVGNLILTSSIAATQPAKGGLNLNETAPYCHHESYGESKRYCEELVLEANGINGLNTIAFITVGLWGPNDPFNFGSVLVTKDSV